jgi:hypothetical protein
LPWSRLVTVRRDIFHPKHTNAAQAGLERALNIGMFDAAASAAFAIRF